MPGRFAGPTTEGSTLAPEARWTVPRSPQGHPVVIQAGQSGAGGGSSPPVGGELLFVIFPTPEGCKAYRDDLRARAAAAGRDPDAVKVAPAVYVVAGETEQEAADKLAFIDGLAHTVDSLALLSEVFNYDFAQHSPGPAAVGRNHGVDDGPPRIPGPGNPVERETPTPL